ncbi:unnamed protein product [Ambrosiozyma monospora]|uniref:Unnamed protein product n=1 Tax=Ambrosiozyma monospora TaxID=43982 RepID=A0ACB5TP30_AMBMO|nr:unnamed protein product [Ambrosiozyma monospora]
MTPAIISSSSSILASSNAFKLALTNASVRRISVLARSRHQLALNSRRFSFPTSARRGYASQASASSTSNLANQEQIANRDLSNAAVQSAFYRSLLQANYPHIVVSRYETPGIATSTECAQLYIEALTKIGDHQKAENVARSLGLSTASSAVAGSGAGSFGGAFGSGSRHDPIHVIVTESPWITFSKWFYH